MWEAVYTPDRVADALEILKSFHPDARIIAGGTDLILQLLSGETHARILVDITRLEGMDTIHLDDENLNVGALVTHLEIACSRLVQRHTRVLALAASEVGSPQIRGVGTIGGNVVNAQPAADTALALIALGADAMIMTEDGMRKTSVYDLYEQPGKSILDSTKEILLGFVIPKPASCSGSAYRRLGKCKSIALPVLCTAGVVKLDATCQTFLDCSLAIGPVAPRPQILHEVTEWIVGKPVTETTINIAAQIARECCHPRDSLLRCSASYREEMVGVLVSSVLANAVQDAKSGKAQE